jgi:hypothetical protein
MLLTWALIHCSKIVKCAQNELFGNVTALPALLYVNVHKRCLLATETVVSPIKRTAWHFLSCAILWNAKACTLVLQSWPNPVGCEPQTCLKLYRSLHRRTCCIPDDHHRANT